MNILILLSILNIAFFLINIICLIKERNYWGAVSKKIISLQYWPLVVAMLLITWNMVLHILVPMNKFSFDFKNVTFTIPGKDIMIGNILIYSLIGLILVFGYYIYCDNIIKSNRLKDPDKLFEKKLPKNKK